MSEINAESTTMPPVELRMPRASEREEMLAGKLYNSVDPELNALREKAGDLCARFNAASRTDHAARAAILDELLPGHGAGLDVMGPIFLRLWLQHHHRRARVRQLQLHCAGLLPGDDWRRRAVRPERFAAATDASVALAGS